MRVPAALVVIPLIAGSAIGLLWGEHVEPGFALWAASAGLIGLLSVAASLADDSPADSAAGIVVTALVLGLSLGVSAAHRAYRPSLLGWFQQGGRPSQPGIVLEGRLREDAANLAAGVSLLLDVDRIGDDPARPVAGGVRLSVAGALAPRAAAAWRAGRRLRVTATLREPAFYLNPGVPDERRPLLRRGIALVGTVKSAALVEVVAPGSAIDERAAALRAWARHALNTAVGRWSQRSAGVATAIVIGDRTGLSQDDERRLQEAGTYHVIAISGGNIAILTVLLLVLLRSLRVPPRLAAAGAIVLLVFYGRITGPSASVDRAVAAAVVVLAGRLLDQRGPPLNVLAVAAILGAATPVGSRLRPRVPPLVRRDAGDSRRRAAACERWIAPGWRAGRGSRRGRGIAGGDALRRDRARARIGSAVRAGHGGRAAPELRRDPADDRRAGRFPGHPGRCIAVLPAAASASGYATHLAALGLVESARLVEVAPWLARDVAPPAWTLIAGVLRRARPLALPRSGRPAPCRLATALFGCVIVAGPAAAARRSSRGSTRGRAARRVPRRRAGRRDARHPSRWPCAARGRRRPADRGAAGSRRGARVRHRRTRRRARAARLRRPPPRGARAHARRSRSPGRRPFRAPPLRGRARSGRACPCRRTRRAALLQDLSRSEGSEWRTVTAGDRVEIAGVEIARSASASARMGAPARPQRRLGCARGPPRRRGGNPARRHRPGR